MDVVMGGFNKVWSGLIGLLLGGGAGFDWLENRVVGPHSTDEAADVPGVGSFILNLPNGSTLPEKSNKIVKLALAYLGMIMVDE